MHIRAGIDSCIRHTLRRDHMDARRPHEAQRHRGEHGRLNEKEKTKKNKKKKRKKKIFFKMKECLVLYSVIIWANKKSGITVWCTAP